MKKSILSFFLFGAILSAAPVSVTLVDAGSPVQNVGSEAVGPYDLSINGVTVQAMCMDDFLTNPVGSKWNANVTAVNGSSFSNTYLGMSGDKNTIGWSSTSYTDKQMYSIEAYLFNELVQPNANRRDIQQAAWDIMDANSWVGDYYGNQDVMSILSDALANYSTFDTTGYQIVTDVNGNGVWRGNQEFMIHTSATPEPATFALMGGGLFAAGALRFMRRKKQAEVNA